MANPSADFPTTVHSPTDTSAFSGSKLGATSPKHTDVEGKQEAEIVAIQEKIGTGSGAPSTGKVLYSSGAGVSGWSDLNTLVDALNNIISISTGLNIFLQHLGRRIAQLYADGDQVHESNVGTVFAQFRHLKLTSLYKNPSILIMRVQYHRP